MDGHRRSPLKVNRADGDYTDDEAGLLQAMVTYQRVNRRRYPTYTEVLAVARSLGYRRVAPARPVPAYREGRP